MAEVIHLTPNMSRGQIHLVLGKYNVGEDDFAHVVAHLDSLEALAAEQARAEVLAASTRLHEAARTVLHIVDGVGKAGGPPQFGEEFAAWKELQASVDKLQPAASDLEALLQEARRDGQLKEALRWFRLHERITELEKARATEEKK